MTEEKKTKTKTKTKTVSGTDSKKDKKTKKAERKPSGRQTQPDKKKGSGRSSANAAASRSSAKAGKTASGNVLKIIPLGGIGEVGKNMTAFEYGGDIVIIDCGVGFPDEDMFGIDLVIPDFSYIEENRDKLRGVLLTHGHEDHIGGIPYFLRGFNVPVYGTALTVGIIQNRLKEHRLPFQPRLNTVKAGDRVKLGVFDAEFIHVNHSIADACAIALSTPVGTVVFSGDFKLDVSPIDEEMTDLTRFGELGRKGVRLLMCESTNAERSGFTPSEKSVGGVLEGVFNANPDKRIVVATFSSNVHRVKQVIDISARLGRKVAVTGRSMLSLVEAATALGYLKYPSDTLIDAADMKNYRPGRLTLITTGSQGEPMSALYRMAFGDRSQITLGQSDVVILSSSTIPGNEKTIGKIINALTRNGIKVVGGSVLAGVHTSGHACSEEIKLLIQLCRPAYYMPVHGEYRHLNANREIAEYLGYDSDHIIMADIGSVVEVGRKTAGISGSVKAASTLIDGYGVGDVGSTVLRDRKHLSEDGVVVVFATVDYDMGYIVSPPEIVSKGFGYTAESGSVVSEAAGAAAAELEDAIRPKRGRPDPENVRERVRRAVLKVLVGRTGKNPVVIPFITDL